MSLKQTLEQRKKDLAGNKTQEAQLIEVEAARMMLADLTQAAQVAREVAIIACVQDYLEPTVEDVITINNLFQAYIGPAYRALVARGEVEPPPVMTVPAGTAHGKDEFTS